MARHFGWLSLFVLALAGCSATAASPAPAAAPTNAVAAATPMPSLASTTEEASEAPAGSIPLTLTLAAPFKPRFQPDEVTASAGTVVFYLKNVPAFDALDDHAMVIGTADVQFYPDGSVKGGQVLADSHHIAASEKAVFTVNGLPPGTYMFWCNVPAGDYATHATVGMIGTLTITP